MNQYDENDEQNGTLLPDRDMEEFDTGFEEEPLPAESPEKNDESDDHPAEQVPEGEDRTEEAETGTEPEDDSVPSAPLPEDALHVAAEESKESGSPGRIDAPEHLAEELKELEKLNPQAAELALEDSPEGEGIRRRLAEYGAMAAQDRAESILDKRERSARAQRMDLERQRQAIEAHNRHFQAVIQRDHPDFTALMSDPGRRAEAAKMMNDIYAWIEAKPYTEAAPLMQIAKSGRNPEEVSALITRFKQERGKHASNRPRPEGAYAVPGRGAAAAPSGDISLRTAGYISKKLLERAQPLLCLSRFGQAKPLPRNVGRSMKFRGYEHLQNQPKPLTEGVTPSASKPTYRDVEASIKQFGDWIELTDVLADTHEDPLIPEFTDILGEQSPIMLERIIAGVLLGGTNVHFAGRDAAGVIATGRDGVNQPLTLAVQRRVMRGLRRQNAQRITSVVSASPNFNTSPIPPSFIAVAHTDLEQDIREMPGFVPTEKYGSYKPLDGEVGSVEGVRYILTTILDPWQDAGAAPLAGTVVESNEGACADVYPVLFFGKNAYGTIPFAKNGRNGASPVTPMVLNPNVPRGGDPLAQRGSIGWKAYQSAVILYDMYMARVECAATKY